MVTESIIQEATRRLVDNFHPASIILSSIRGAATGTEDLDIIVVCPLAPGASRRAMNVAMDRALRGLDLPRQITILTPEEFATDRKCPGTIAQMASLEGKVVYGVAA